MRFRRPEGAEALERYTIGLLTELPNKNCDTIAQAVPGTSEQRLQEFLTNMQWDEEDLNQQRVHKMMAEATLGDGVPVLDDTGFAKQGKLSVGVRADFRVSHSARGPVLRRERISCSRRCPSGSGGRSAGGTGAKGGYARSSSRCDASALPAPASGTWAG